MKHEELEKQNVAELERLRSELMPKILPEQEAQANPSALDQFLSSSTALDETLTRYVVLHEMTTTSTTTSTPPKGKGKRGQSTTTSKSQSTSTNNLAEFESYKNKYWGNTNLIKEMLVADGAKDGQWGHAFKILSSIEAESEHARAENGGILRRLAIAISLEHAVPLAQDNPKDCAATADKFVDPVRRYLNYEMAYLEGELDPAFPQLSIWELRFVVDGEEPDETLAWGRDMMRNFRPDHVLGHPDYTWRYTQVVRTDVRYGSHLVKNDRPELQQYQNIIMNGGVCGRRAFIGRHVLRAFGIPTTARPSPGHGALCHWTPTKGWVVNLGGSWGCGTTKTQYRKDVDFLATTQARTNHTDFCKVKRAQWIGDVVGEQRVYGENENENKKNPIKIGFWNGVALQVQRAIIDNNQNMSKVNKMDDKMEHSIPNIIEKAMKSPALPDAKKIRYNKDTGVIVIPAAAFDNPKKTKDVTVTTSFPGGFQIYLPAFTPQGLTVLRGGSWKGNPDACNSGFRLLSGGYGKYEDWGFRVAVGSYDEEGDASCRQEQLTMDLGVDGLVMELVYVKPGTFEMGGESTTDGKFSCVEVPKHKVTLTKGYYLGKYPVTQKQYQAVMGSNPSKSTKSPDCPVDNVSEEDALKFCTNLVDTIGKDVRLPTEAEWEYASRAGSTDGTKWCFGNDPSQLGEYAWFKDNSGGKSHPVGQKNPNLFGLYDMYGNVNERIADKYAKNYYAKSPPADPTGPVQGTKSKFEFTVQIEQAGTYLLTAEVVTVNYDQRLNVAVNPTATNAKDDETIPDGIDMEMPFTLGQWQDTAPVKLALKNGKNKLLFWRDKPPQYGLVIRSFTLKPAN